VLNSALEPTLDDRADYHAMMAAAGGALPSAAPGGGGSAICRCRAYFDGLAAAVRARPGRLSGLSVFQCIGFCKGLLYGHAWRLTAQNGGFRPVQAGGGLGGLCAAAAVSLEQLSAV
jgi:hypothetical protein